MIRYICDECLEDVMKEELSSIKIDTNKEDVCLKCLQYINKVKKFKQNNSKLIESSTFFNSIKFYKLVNIIDAYSSGLSVIYCSPQFFSQMCNFIMHDNFYTHLDKNIEEKAQERHSGRFRGHNIYVTNKLKNPAIGYIIPINNSIKENIYNIEEIEISKYKNCGQYYIASLDKMS